MRRLFFSLTLAICSCNSYQENVSGKTTFTEGRDFIDSLQIGDSIDFGFRSSARSWKLISAHKSTAIFLDKKGIEKTISKNGFLPGSIMTKFQVKGGKVLVLDNPLPTYIDEYEGN